jgi:hypothetical protein
VRGGTCALIGRRERRTVALEVLPVEDHALEAIRRLMALLEVARIRRFHLGARLIDRSREPLPVGTRHALRRRIGFLRRRRRPRGIHLPERPVGISAAAPAAAPAASPSATPATPAVGHRVHQPVVRRPAGPGHVLAVGGDAPRLAGSVCRHQMRLRLRGVVVLDAGGDGEDHPLAVGRDRGGADGLQTVVVLDGERTLRDALASHGDPKGRQHDGQRCSMSNVEPRHRRLLSALFNAHGAPPPCAHAPLGATRCALAAPPRRHRGAERDL